MFNFNEAVSLLNLEGRKVLKLEDMTQVVTCYGAPYYFIYFKDGTALRIPNSFIPSEKFSEFMLSLKEESVEKLPDGIAEVVEN